MAFKYNPEARNLAKRLGNAAALVLLANSIPGVAHALQPKQPENNSNGSVGLVDQSGAKQRVRRLRGGGPRINSQTVTDSKTLIASLDGSARFQQQKKPSSSTSTHNLYSSGKAVNKQVYNHFASNVSLAKQQAILGKPLEHRGREGVEEVVQSVNKLIGLLEQFAPGEAKMFNKTLSLIKSGAIPNLSISSIEQQMIEVLDHSVASILQKASVDDIQRLANLDFKGIKSPGLASIINAQNISANQLQQLQTKTVEISEIVNANFTHHELVDYLKDVKVNFLPSALMGLDFLLLLTAISRQAVDNKDGIKRWLKDHKRSLLVAGGVTALVGILACVIGTAVLPTLSPTIDSPATEISTVVSPSASPPAEVGSPTPDAKIDQTLPPVFSNIYPGTSDAYGPSSLYGGANIVGAIQGGNVRDNNPGFRVPIREGINECRINVLYNKNNPSVPAGIQIDQAWLMSVFKAAEGKSGVIGALPDGTQIELTDHFWIIQKNGEKLFLNPVVANLINHPFGYPCLVQDANGKFFIGILDENGALVENAKFDAAFQPAKDIAKMLGYSGDLSKITSIGYDPQGNLIIKDASGQILSHLAYLNPPFITVEPSPSPLPPAVTMQEIGINDPEISKVFKGIEATIHRESTTTFSVNAIGYQGETKIQGKYTIDTTTFSGNFDIKNDFRPATVDAYAFDDPGKVHIKLIWDQEHSNWRVPFVMEDVRKADQISFVPEGDEKIAIESALLYFKDHPLFTDAAAENYKKHSDYGNALFFEYLSDGGKRVTLRSTGNDDPILTLDNITMKVSPLWIQQRINGVLQSEALIGILDPADPKNPQADEYKILIGTRGDYNLADGISEQEKQFLEEDFYNEDTFLVPRPILFANDIYQTKNPLLAQLLSLPGNNPGTLEFWRSDINIRMGELSSANTSSTTPLITSGIPYQVPPEIQIMRLFIELAVHSLP